MSPRHSSEQVRKRPQTWKKDTKIVIGRTEVVPYDTSTLPADAQFKGYHPEGTRVVVQNLILKTDNVAFERAKYYSPSTGKTYPAPLPPGYEGAFGPDLKALVLGLHHLGNVSQPALHTFLTHAGIRISSGEVSNLLVTGQEHFHHEKLQIGTAGLASSPWHQTDDTATRVDGVNQHAHVLGNPLYTTYTTLPHKDRLSVLSVLLNGQPLSFLLTPEVLASEAVSKLPQKSQRRLATLPKGTLWDEASLGALLDTSLPTLSVQGRKSVMEQMALAAYRAQTTVPIVRIQQTRANKDKLLMVLFHPEIPLHNNASELAVRRRVRKRDVSFGPRSAAGVAAWDTFQTLAPTAQKLGVSFLAYLSDRVSGRNALPSLASIITQRARHLDLGASWT